MNPNQANLYQRLNTNSKPKEDEGNYLKTWVKQTLLQTDEFEKMFKEKVENKIVHLSGMSLIKSKEKKRILAIVKRMKKAKPLTCKEKRESGIYEIPEEAKKYEYFVPLNKLWQQYVDELVCNEGKEKIKNQLLKMDYHGSILKVIRSTNPSLIGKQGIVIQETKNVFKMIQKDDKVVIIPKNNSEFEIQVKSFRYRIMGSNFCYKPYERASKKFKLKKNNPFC